MKYSAKGSAVRSAAVAAAAVLAITLAACGNSGSNATEITTITKTVTASGAPSAGKTPAASHTTSASHTPTARNATSISSSDSQVLAFGATSSRSGGITVRISKPTRYNASSSESDDEPDIVGSKWYEVAITVTNGADAKSPFNMSQISLSATSGTSTVTTIADCGTPTQPGCNEPSSYLLQGRSVTWYEAYPVVPGTRLTVEVDNLGNFSQTTPPIFDGTVS